ncbi:STAS domain-containing protein [Streptomyces sp. NPDC047928]|uniref:STAS domain-containing protein n=1 Tax=unclassified Streptomyces TaxID=2593676 RepID=UPI00371CF7B1
MKNRDPIVLRLAGPVEPADVPRLRARLAEQLGARASPEQTVVVDVTDLAGPGLAAVDALARLHLTARRLGHRLTVRGADADLRALLDLVGLADRLLPLTPPAGPEGRTGGTSASRPGTT